VIRSESGTTVHCCVSLLLKSESLPYQPGFPRFDWRVLPFLSILADKWAALFYLRENHMNKKEGCK